MSLTAKEKEVFDLQEKNMSIADIARKLNRDESSIRERLKRAKKKMNMDPAVKEAMSEMGISTVPKTVWFKNDKYSIQVYPEDIGKTTLAETLEDTLSNLPSAMVIPKPKRTIEDLMAVYPLFDLHIGLRAHEEVSGTNVDLDSAKKAIIEAMAEVIDRTPNARRGVIINGGDFTHQTDDSNMTRRSGHILDVSARNAQTVEAALEVICTLIEMALRKHQIVEYYSVPGNHDPQNWETLQFALRERYRKNSRVIINVRWDEFSIIEHGQVALFIHHGDKRKPKDIAMFCAAAFKEVWGRTNYRMLLTGHLHHMREDEMPGIIWKQLSAATARDHYAASHGYFSYRIINSMVFDLRSKKYEYSAMM
jgi:predicted phosphodiesterase